MPSDVNPGDVVQVDPRHDPTFGGALLVVEEVKGWGVQGAVAIPGQGITYYRCPAGAFAPVGRAAWLAPDFGLGEWRRNEG